MKTALDDFWISLSFLQSPVYLSLILHSGFNRNGTARLEKEKLFYAVLHYETLYSRDVTVHLQPSTGGRGRRSAR